MFPVWSGESNDSLSPHVIYSCIHFLWCSRDTGRRNMSSQLDFWYEKPTLEDYSVFILLALKEECDFFLSLTVKTSIFWSSIENLPPNWFKYHCNQVLQNGLAGLLITQTHEHMDNNIQVPLPITKGALRIATFFSLFFFGIPTWMNVWLCYFSRSGRLAHVVDSLINASLGINKTCFLTLSSISTISCLCYNEIRPMQF